MDRYLLVDIYKTIADKYFENLKLCVDNLGERPREIGLNGLRSMNATIGHPHEQRQRGIAEDVRRDLKTFLDSELPQER